MDPTAGGAIKISSGVVGENDAVGVIGNEHRHGDTSIINP
jgi:hypothetical protein